MANIDVEVNARSYSVACEAGQENHVRDLARYLDAHIQNLKKSGVKTADINYMVLASLILADELTEAHNTIDQLKEDLDRKSRSLPQGGAAAPAGDDPRVTGALDQIANRLETVADQLGAA